MGLYSILCTGGIALLQFTLFSIGLPAESSDDSLEVPCDGGLATDGALKPVICGGADEGSMFSPSDFCFFPSAMKLPTTTCIEFSESHQSKQYKKNACNNVSRCRTCTGPAAISIPATPPPSTRPSGPAKAMLKPPVLLRVPPFSVSK